MSISKKIVIISIILAIGCFGLAFYLSKYHKDPFAEISFTSSGCFHHSVYTLSLIKEDSLTIARLDSGSVRLNETYISNSQLNKFYVFVNEIPKAREGSCTSVDHYVIKLNGEVKRKTSESCYSFSLRKLLESYFGYYL